jgi:hypothetical protein
MRYSTDKECNRLIGSLVDAGWLFVRGTKHDKLTAPNGRLLVVPRTPSDWRVYMNLKRDVRRVISA